VASLLSGRPARNPREQPPEGKPCLVVLAKAPERIPQPYLEAALDEGAVTPANARAEDLQDGGLEASSIVRGDLAADARGANAETEGSAASRRCHPAAKDPALQEARPTAGSQAPAQPQQTAAATGSRALVADDSTHGPLPLTPCKKPAVR
jgi:hypothetical protein